MTVLPPDVVRTMVNSGLSLAVFERLRTRLRSGRWTEASNRLPHPVEPPADRDIERLPADVKALRDRGESALRDGEVGVVLLNGGMATRFGEQVKGVVMVAGGASFLGLKLRDAQRAAARAGGPPVPVILMNSVATAAATALHLDHWDRFGMPGELVWSFEQHWAPRLCLDGELFRDAEGKPSFCGTGHGDLPECLAHSGLLDRFAERGGRHLLMSNVDNAAATLDPVLLGWHLTRGTALTVEVVDKVPGDAGGAPMRVGGRPQIVEAFRLPSDVAPDASPVFNTNTLWLSLEALRAPAELTWLRVQKVVAGQSVVQFERLVGELSAFVDTAFLHVSRAGLDSRFVPVKTPEDLASARDALLAVWSAR